MQQVPLAIEIPQSDLDDLKDRLSRTRWPNEISPRSAEAGPSLQYLRDLVTYWQDGYDWRAVEASLNRFDHAIAQVGGTDLHFIHRRSDASDAIPVILLHGWADSFYRYIKLIDLLASPGDEGPVFDVVVPSLPGFAFSGQPGPNEMSAAFAANAIAELMAGLGYEKYLVHGGDWGSAVAEELARNHPDQVIGLHLVDVPYHHVFMVDREEVSDAEREFLEWIDAWGETDAAYVSVQSTKPLMLSYGLSDSPVGLAAWLIDHFERLSTSRFGHDDLITNTLLYWFTNTFRSSVRYYNEGMGGDWSDDSAWADDADGTDSGEAGDWSADRGEDWGDGAGWDPKVNLPTAIAVFPDDIGRPPREFAERFFDIRRFTEMEHGGHFAALEVPDLVADDIRAFVAELEHGSP